MLTQTDQSLPNPPVRRPLLSRTEQAHLEMGWQQITAVAAERMNAANLTDATTWVFDNVEDARQQARRLAAAQWLYYTRHINEFCGGPEQR